MNTFHRSFPPGGFRFAWIVLVALLLRLFLIGQQSFWSDEMLTLVSTTKHGDKFYSFLQTAESNKPPLYYWMFRAWTDERTNETTARLPSAFMGAMSCGLLYLLVRRLSSETLALGSASLLTLSPWHLWYSQETRMYAMWVFLSLAMLLSAVRFLQKPGLSSWLLFVITGALCCYSYSYGFFGLALTTALLWGWRKNLTWTEMGVYAGAHLCIFLIFAPWLARMVLSSNAPTGQFYKGPPWIALGYAGFNLGYGATLGPTTEQLRLFGPRIIHEAPLSVAVMIPSLLALGLLMLCGLWSLRRNKALLILSGGGLLIYMLFPAVVSLLKPTVTLNPRYTFFSVVPAMILVAEGMLFCWKMKGGWRFLPLVFGAFFLLSVGNFYFNSSYFRDDVRLASEFVQEKGGKLDLVIVAPSYTNLVMRHYWQQDTPLEGFEDYLGWSFLDRPETVNLRRLKKSRFAWVYLRPDHIDPKHRIPGWLHDNFRVVEERTWTGVKVFICEPK
jgi:4-amino-4-deoxy-L-arabinose transferase-like glycosyltransferase